jgi:hypothetical protein
MANEAVKMFLSLVTDTLSVTIKPLPLSPPLHKCGEGDIGGEVKGI